MGYDLYITHKKYFSDEEGKHISQQEWLDYVEHHSELEHEAGPNTHGFVVWDPKQEHINYWLDWSDGQLDSKNPDHDFIEKMLRIAGDLNARVIGEEGEEYSPEPFGYSAEALHGGRLQFHRRSEPRAMQDSETSIVEPNSRTDYGMLRYQVDQKTTYTYFNSQVAGKSDYEQIFIEPEPREPSMSVDEIAQKLRAAKDRDLANAKRPWWKFW